MQSNEQTNGTEITKEAESEREEKKRERSKRKKATKTSICKENTHAKNHGVEANNTGTATPNYTIQTENPKHSRPNALHQLVHTQQLAKLVHFVASFRVAAHCVSVRHVTSSVVAFYFGGFLIRIQFIRAIGGCRLVKP